MNLLKNEYINAIRAQKSIKRQAILGLQKIFTQSKDGKEAQLIDFILRNPQNITSSEIDALIMSLDRETKSSFASSLKPAC